MNSELIVDVMEELRKRSSAPFLILSVNTSPHAIATKDQAHVAFDIDTDNVIYPKIHSLHFYF